MDEKLRVQELARIKANDPAFMTGIRIQFEGQTRPFNAYKIPLRYLIYNKYNGRIGSLVKSYEKQNHPLNPEKPEDIKMIEQFLGRSTSRNTGTEISLVKEQQKQYGIVTHDGIIVDGNRRAYLLNKIYRERGSKWKDHDVSHCEYFTAVILDVGASPKEISKLETTYQMGEDSKLDYDAIEKYLKIKDLSEIYEFSIQDIADMMSEKKPKIEEYLEIMKLMDEYLIYLGYDGIYTRLDNREGQFVDLNSYLNRWKAGKANKSIDWGYSDADLADLKSVCFDYIRAEYEGKEFRNIARTSGPSIFSTGAAWAAFLKRHAEKIESVKEKSVEQYVEENKGAELYKVLETRDAEWKKRVEKPLVENLRRSQDRVEAASDANKPQILLNKALDSLKAINSDSENFTDSANETILKQIQKITYEYLKKF